MTNFSSLVIELTVNKNCKHEVQPFEEGVCLHNLVLTFRLHGKDCSKCLRSTHSKKNQPATDQPSGDRVKVVNVGGRGSDKTKTTFENDVGESSNTLRPGGNTLRPGWGLGLSQKPVFCNTLKRQKTRLTVTSEKCLAGEKCTFHPLCLFVHRDGDNDQMSALQRNIVDVLPTKIPENVEKIPEDVRICPIGGENRNQRKQESKKMKEKQEQQKMTTVGDRGHRDEANLKEGGVPSAETLRLTVEDQSEIKQINIGPDNSSEMQEQQESERRPVSNLLMLQAKKIKEKREAQERMKAITLHPPPDQVTKRSEHQELTGEDRMSTEEIARSSRMRNKKEEGDIPSEGSGRLGSVPKVAKSSVHQELTGEDRNRFRRNKSEELLEAAIGGFYLPDLLQDENFKLEDAFVDNLCKAVEKAIFALFPSVGAFYTRKQGLRNVSKPEFWCLL